MLDEKRIRQMTKLAFFEKKEEKNALRIGRYFRSDYIGKELLKNFSGFHRIHSGTCGCSLISY